MTVKNLFNTLDQNKWEGDVFFITYADHKEDQLDYFHFTPELEDFDNYNGDDTISFNTYHIIKDKKVEKFTLLVDESGLNTEYLFMELSNENIPYISFYDKEFYYTPLQVMVDEVCENKDFDGTFNFVFRIKDFVINNTKKTIIIPFNKLTYEKVYDIIKGVKIDNSKDNIINTHNLIITARY